MGSVYRTLTCNGTLYTMYVSEQWWHLCACPRVLVTISDEVDQSNFYRWGALDTVGNDFRSSGDGVLRSRHQNRAFNAKSAGQHLSPGVLGSTLEYSDVYRAAQHVL